MSDQRKLKKSESLEIRLPYPAKQAFMARCQAEGRSASEALRGFIDREIEGRRPDRRRLRQLAAGAFIAAAVGAIAAPTLARPSPDAEFHRLDRNGDGRITLQEFRQGHLF
jgi:hypothetical protein